MSSAGQRGQPFRNFERGARLRVPDVGLMALARSAGTGGGIFRGGISRRNDGGAASEIEKEQIARQTPD
jgi:hypothetical protein